MLKPVCPSRPRSYRHSTTRASIAPLLYAEPLNPRVCYRDAEPSTTVVVSRVSFNHADSLHSFPHTSCISSWPSFLLSCPNTKLPFTLSGRTSPSSSFLLVDWSLVLSFLALPVASRSFPHALFCLIVVVAGGDSAPNSIFVGLGLSFSFDQRARQLQRRTSSPYHRKRCRISATMDSLIILIIRAHAHRRWAINGSQRAVGSSTLPSLSSQPSMSVRLA